MKTVSLPDYKYIFDEQTGFFARWGATREDDPVFSPIGPEILDLEASEKCSQGCKMCYKSNVSKGKNMSLETFKTVIDKMPTILQIAFGIGDIDGNPDLFSMMEYARSKNVVPNITINGNRMTKEYFDNLKKYCGAVAVSNYGKESCYGAVRELATVRNMDQINIHQLLSQETLSQVLELINDYEKDYRLQYLNAIVFLSLKQKGRGISYHRVSDEDFKMVIDLCLEKNIRFGFDSCSANKFANVISGNLKYQSLLQYVEPCESTLFSSYVNVNGDFYPCSFAETGEGISVVNSIDFLQDVWYNERTVEWRKNLIANCRNCPIYDV